MTKKIFIGFAVLLVMIMINACDKVEKNEDGNYTEGVVLPPDGGTAVLFEFTGWECVNCPRAHREIAKLHEAFGDRFLPISIHAGMFAKPLCNDTCLDFRTSVGNELHDDIFTPIMYPIGAINGLGSEYLEPSDSWGESALKVMYEKSIASVSIVKTIKKSKIKLTVTVEFTAPSIPKGEYWLGLYLVENGVIGPQKDGSEEIEEYEHEHMLRASFNGTLGEKIVTNPIMGSTFHKDSYELDIKDDWKAKDLHVVPFIYIDDITNVTKRVIPFQVVSEE
jgi:hypothetical protein